jgi:hypothetical protein
MFTLQIQCPTLDDAERIMATLRATGGERDINHPADDALDLENEPAPESSQLIAARAALRTLQAKYGADDMRVPLEVLGRFNAGHIREVRPDDYDALIAACKAA